MAWTERSKCLPYTLYSRGNIFKDGNIEYDDIAYILPKILYTRDTESLGVCGY